MTRAEAVAVAKTPLSNKDDCRICHNAPRSSRLLRGADAATALLVWERIGGALLQEPNLADACRRLIAAVHA
ncbi:hypothetical protein C0075_00500 [Rhizobium sp. KAs_5_22]|nr:hypothetical protein C0075_00500 [Rhizobium sp. KAs_5_22]